MPDMSDVFEEGSEALREFKEQIKDAAGAMSDLRSIDKTLSSSLKEVNSTLGSIGGALDKFAGSLNKSSAEGKAFSDKADKLKGKLSTLTTEISSSGTVSAKSRREIASLESELSRLGDAAFAAEKKFEDFSKEMKKAATAEGVLTSATSIASGSIQGLAKSIQDFRGETGKAVAATGLLAGATLFLGKAAGDLAKKYREVVKDVNAYQIQLEATSKISLASPSGMSGLEDLRSSLGTTRAEFQSFLPVVNELSKIGIDTSSLQDAAKSVTALYGEGSKAQEALKDYTDLLQKMPSLAQDLSFNASADDKAAAMFAMAESGSIDVAIKAGLLGGIEPSSEAAGIQTDIQKSIRVQEDIKNEMKNMIGEYSKSLPLLEKIGQYTAIAGGAIGTLILPAITMAASTAFAQRNLMIGAMGEKSVSGKLKQGKDFIGKMRGAAGKANTGGASGFVKGMSKGGSVAAKGMGLAGKSAAIAGKAIAALGVAAAVAAAAYAGWKIGSFINDQIKSMSNLTEKMKANSAVYQDVNSVLYGTSTNLETFSKQLASGTMIEAGMKKFQTVMDVSAGKTGTFGDSLSIAADSIGYTNLALLSLIPGVGTATAAFLLFSKASKFQEELTKATKLAKDRMKDLAERSGYPNYEAVQVDMKRMSDAIKVTAQVQIKGKQSALQYQQALKSIEAASKSAAVRIYQFGADSAKANMEVQKALGASSDSYFDNASTITKTLGQALGKRARDVGTAMEKAVKDLGNSDPQKLSMVYQKAQKTMADETKKFVSAFESVIQQLARTPAIIEAELKGELAGMGNKLTSILGGGLDITATTNALNVQFAAATTQIKESGKVFEQIPNQMANFQNGLDQINKANQGYTAAAIQSLPKKGSLHKAVKEALAGPKRKGETDEQQAARGSANEDALREAASGGEIGGMESLKEVADNLRTATASSMDKLETLESAQVGLTQAISLIGGNMQGKDLTFKKQKGDIKRQEKVIKVKLELEQLRGEIKSGTLGGDEKAKKQKRVEHLESQYEGSWSSDPDATAREVDQFKSLEGKGTEELKKMLVEKQAEMKKYDNALQATKDQLMALGDMKADELAAAGIHNVKQARELAAAIAENPDMGMREVSDVAARVFGEKQAPKAMADMAEAANKAAASERDKAGQLQKASMAVSSESNRLEKTAIVQSKLVKAAVDASYKALQNGMKAINDTIKAEGDRLKSAKIDVEVMEAFDASVFGMPLEAFSERYEANLEVLRATSENTSIVRKNAMAQADALTASLIDLKGKMPGQKGKEKATDQVKSDMKSGKIDKQTGEELIGQIAAEFDPATMKEIIKKGIVRDTLKQQMNALGKVFQETLKEFDSTSEAKAINRTMKEVEGLMSVAEYGFVDMRAQASEALALVRKKGEGEIAMYSAAAEAAKNLQTDIDNTFDVKLQTAKDEGKGPEAILEIERQRAAVMDNAISSEIANRKKGEMALVNMEKKRLEIMFKAIDLEKRRSEISEEMVQTELSILEQIGAPYASILEAQGKIVAEAKKQAAFETEKYDAMSADVKASVKGREQELKMVKANAKVVQSTIQAQRSAMEKLLGAAIGELGNIGGFKRNLLAQQKGTGLTVGPGGIVQGGAGSAISKSKQAAAILAGSMTAGATKSSGKKESKDIKEATDKSSSATDKNTDTMQKNTEAISSLSSNINNLLNNRSSIPTNVKIPQGKAGTMGISGTNDQTASGGVSRGKVTKNMERIEKEFEMKRLGFTPAKIKGTGAGGGGIGGKGTGGTGAIKQPEKNDLMAALPAKVEDHLRSSAAKVKFAQKDMREITSKGPNIEETEKEIVSKEKDLVDIGKDRVKQLDQIKTDRQKIRELEGEQRKSDQEERKKINKINSSKKEALGLASKMGRTQEKITAVKSEFNPESAKRKEEIERLKSRVQSSRETVDTGREKESNILFGKDGGPGLETQKTDVFLAKLERKPAEEKLRKARATYDVVKEDSAQFKEKIGPQEYASTDHLNKLGEESAAAFRSGDISFDQYTARQDELTEVDPEKRTNQEILSDMIEDTKRMESGEVQIQRGSEYKIAGTKRKREALEGRMNKKAKRQIAKERGVINFADQGSVDSAMEGVTDEEIAERTKKLTDKYLVDKSKKEKGAGLTAAPATGISPEGTATSVEKTIQQAKFASTPGAEALGVKTFKSDEQLKAEQAATKETVPKTTEDESVTEDKKEDKKKDDEDKKEQKEQQEKQILAMQEMKEELEKLNGLVTLLKDDATITAKATQSLNTVGVTIRS